MTYEECHNFDTMEILEIMHEIDEDIAMLLHSTIVYHTCAKLPESATHCLFSSVLYSVLKTKDKQKQMLQFSNN